MITTFDEIKSKIEFFKRYNPLEYDSLIKRIIRKDNLNSFILEYKDTYLLDCYSKPLIHILSFDFYESENILFIYHNNDLISKSSEVELKVTTHFDKDHKKKQHHLDYIMNDVMSNKDSKIKYQKDESFKKIVDLLRSDCVDCC